MVKGPLYEKLSGEDESDWVKVKRKPSQYRTNSIEWLIEESDRRRAAFEAETRAQHASRIEMLKKYWEANKARYNANRRQARHEARDKLLAKSPNLVKRVGRPVAPLPPVDANLSALQGQAKVKDTVSEHVDYVEIPIPVELKEVFNDTSEHPVIMINPLQGMWPMYHIKPFASLKDKT